MRGASKLILISYDHNEIVQLSVPEHSATEYGFLVYMETLTLFTYSSGS